MTPKSPHLEKLLQKLNAKYLIKQVPVITESYAEKLNCFNNVLLKVKRDGGSILYGWAIYQTNILCEAERHAIWKDTDGNLVDITPKEIPLKQITFLPDYEDFEYNGQNIDNVRINITKNEIVDHYIKVCELLGEYYDLCERKDEKELIAHPNVAMQINKYKELKYVMELYIYSGATMESKCICRRQNIYKDCHGKTLINDLDEEYNRVLLTLNNN